MDRLPLPHPQPRTWPVMEGLILESMLETTVLYSLADGKRLEKYHLFC